MKSRALAADPATLFRSGGRTLADVARTIAAPPWIPASWVHDYQFEALMNGVGAANNRFALLLKGRRA